MGYNESLSNRVRELLSGQTLVEEKKMFRSLCFMVNDKMCICVSDHDLLCRIGKQEAAKELEKGNCRQMINNGRVMKDFVFVSSDDVKTAKDLEYWVAISLDFNKKAKTSKKRKKLNTNVL